MNEEELAALVLALRHLQRPPEGEKTEISSWRLAARFPELDLLELRAMSGGRDVW